MATKTLNKLRTPTRGASGLATKIPNKLGTPAGGEKNMTVADFVIRRMNRDEVGLAIAWAADEGWNPGLHDAECFYVADPNGFFLGELNGQPIGCISAVAYDATFGFIGLYIVKPEFRGRGLGLQLWHEAMRYMGNRNVGLDGVVAQQGNYRKSGFQLAYRNIRCQGNHFGQQPTLSGIVELSALPFEAIVTLDRTLFPAPRRAFLKHWIHQPDARALGIIRDSGLVGYGVIRTCRVGFKIGPLFAEDAQVAESLLLSLAQRASGGPVFLDIPEVNPEAVALVKRYNMESVFETARMYTQGEPDLPLHQIFGVTTFELG